MRLVWNAALSQGKNRRIPLRNYHTICFQKGPKPFREMADSIFRQEVYSMKYATYLDIRESKKVQKDHCLHVRRIQQPSWRCSLYQTCDNLNIDRENKGNGSEYIKYFKIYLYVIILNIWGILEKQIILFFN